MGRIPECVEKVLRKMKERDGQEWELVEQVTDPWESSRRHRQREEEAREKILPKQAYGWFSCRGCSNECLVARVGAFEQEG